MNDKSLEPVEMQLSGLRPVGAPRELRGAVLADVRRELRASRWDRRLARAAAILLIVGVGMNGAMVMQSIREDRRAMHIAESESRQSLMDTAVVVAEATDARTGSEYARQLAFMIGEPLSDDEAAAINAAVNYTPSDDRNGKKG
jgi:hypothetical protein